MTISKIVFYLYVDIHGIGYDPFYRFRISRSIAKDYGKYVKRER